MKEMPLRIAIRRPLLHPRQIALLRETHRYRRERGYPPTIRDLMRLTGIPTTSSVTWCIARLVRAGLLSNGASYEPRARCSSQGYVADWGYSVRARTLAVNYNRVLFIDGEPWLWEHAPRPAP